MANFNDFDDVRVWVGLNDMDALRASTTDGSLRGKTLEVALAYIEHVEEHGFDAIEEDEDEDDDLKWEWRPWRVVIVALFLLGPPLIVWAVRTLEN